MARQEGLIPFVGRVGNLSFYKTKEDGYLVRKVSGVSRERIMNDSNYVRTRENNAEFARGAQAVKLVRSAFFSFLRDVADKRMTGRLTSIIMRIIKEDAVNNRGERVVTNDEVGRLQGFEFNKHAALEKTFRAPFTASLDRASGKMVVDIPAFSPDNLVAAPPGATHVRLMAIGASIDFAKNTYSTVSVQSPDIAVDAKMQEALQLTKTLAPASESPLFLLLAIEFVQVVNGISEPLSDRAFNAMSMVRVDGTSLAVVSSESIETTEPVEIREESTPVVSVNDDEVKTPERKRTPQPVVKKVLLPERALSERLRMPRAAVGEDLVAGRSRGPLPVIDERLSHELSHWKLSDLGLQGHPLAGGRKLFDDGGSIVSFLNDMSYQIAKNKTDDGDGVHVEVSDGLRSGDG